MSHNKETEDRVMALHGQLTYMQIAEIVLGSTSKQSTVGDIIRRVKRREKEASKEVTPIRLMMIPDPQVKKGVPLNHLSALGNYIADKRPEVIVCIGDFADMPSLSQYDKAGSKKTEGSRYKDDIAAVHEAMDVLLSPFRGIDGYNPRMVMTLGNHEHRITRAIEDNPKHFEGVIGLEDLKYEEAGWEVFPFLEMVEIEGIYFSHYFVNPNSLTKNTLGGTVDTKLKNLGFSFCMGHQQTLQMGLLPRSNGTTIQGLVAGAFYQHNEGYMGIQGNKSHWRGAVMLNELQDGKYDIMPLSMDYLLRKWDY